MITKRYRIIELSVCDEHQRVSVTLLSEDGPKPEKFIKEKLAPKAVAGGALMFQIVQPQMMPQPHLHGVMTFDLSPEEYAKLGSPAVNQTIVFKIEVEKQP